MAYYQPYNYNLFHNDYYYDKQFEHLGLLEQQLQHELQNHHNFLNDKLKHLLVEYYQVEIVNDHKQIPIQNDLLNMLVNSVLLVLLLRMDILYKASILYLKEDDLLRLNIDLQNSHNLLLERDNHKILNQNMHKVNNHHMLHYNHDLLIPTIDWHMLLLFLCCNMILKKSKVNKLLISFLK